MTFVISGGEPRAAARQGGALAPLPVPGLPNIRYLAPHPWAVRLLGKDRPYVDYESLVRRIPILFSCVTRLCFWTARVTLETCVGEFADNRSLARDTDLARLIRKPNAQLRWNAYIRDWVGWDYYVWGNAVIVKDRPSPGAPPTALLPIPWKWVFPVYDAGERIIAYQVWLGASSPVGGGEYVTLTPDQVIHHRWPKGIAPIEPLARSLGIEDAALTYQAESLHNGVMPRQAFSTDKVLKKSDFPRLREELGKLYAGAEGAGRMAIFDHDLKPSGVIGVSPADVALKDQRALTQHDVAAAFDVVPAFLGMADLTSRTDLPTLRSYQFRDSIGPKVDALQADYLSQLVDPEPIWASEDYYLLPNMDTILLPDPQVLAQVDLLEQQASTTTTNERRRRRGDPPQGDPNDPDNPANQVLVPLNMRAINEPAPTAEGAMRPGPGGAGVAAPQPAPQEPQNSLVAGLLERGDGDEGGDDE